MWKILILRLKAMMSNKFKILCNKLLIKIKLMKIMKMIKNLKIKKRKRMPNNYLILNPQRIPLNLLLNNSLFKNIKRR